MQKYKSFSISLVLLAVLIISAACASEGKEQAASQVLEPTPTLVAVGSTIEKPVPYGYDIILEEVVLRVDEIIHSDHTILATEDGESMLEDGQEFLLVRITSQCIKPGNNNCFISPIDYQIVDSAGNLVLAEEELTGLHELIEASEVSSGASRKGMLAFRVNKDESYSILAYKQFNGSQVYLSLAY